MNFTPKYEDTKIFSEINQNNGPWNNRSMLGVTIIIVYGQMVMLWD
jgi:hypothetical protein